MKLPAFVKWSELKVGDLIWDPEDPGYAVLLLVSRRGTRSRWRTLDGHVAPGAWTRREDDPPGEVVLVARRVRPYAENVRHAWQAAETRSRYIAAERTLEREATHIQQS